MKIYGVYWKSLVMDMLLVYQGLFVASAVWDFFMTVVMPTSMRSHVFSILSHGLSAFVILPWLVGIFILIGLLFSHFIINVDYKSITLGTLWLEYGPMMYVYVILFIISIFNPLVGWPLVLNYLTSIFWIISLIHFRLSVLDSASGDNNIATE